MLTYERLHRPSDGVIELLKSKIHQKGITQWIADHSVESVGLIQGQLAQIIVAMDVAEKAAEVKVAEVTGICPAHVVLIAVIGSAASVAAAMDAVKEYMEQNRGH